MSAADAAEAPVELPGWRHVRSGKVRDLYEPASAAPGTGDLLVVASDRVSAFDHVLPSPVPDKGAVLTALSLWWFERLADEGLRVPDHVLSADVGPDDASAGVPAAVAGRAVRCRRLEMLPVECVARGYLTGSGLLDYRATGAVCGVELPPGLVDGSRLEAPVFTPATKAEVGHDENVPFAVVADELGGALAGRAREITLELYALGERVARERGVLLADTKIELGLPPGTDLADPAAADALVLADEVLTPDSSRFWDAASWEPGRAQPSFDKQFVRDWLLSDASGWDRGADAPPPPLPDDVVAATRGRYVEAYERITGRRWG
ncbi:phosphoribosylaminoimidazolesuccinocarboxamide synthase [Pseudokineococcus lusitanus]|uniref:Phosphoribosylaminoimidazole-succinocarboxamide synthase n=1 Tax=Pseudokineococcus lusitanus TaxID=763993 RepID=A0A3N1GAP1_9ACTN|nr:phosphoribosylaminoimidazolesuccinocarboxamide synthase [Pseudokineococcus lusitanus]ROP27281.1 phosphoribosylaminoimidazole-succinocarboxamide synthase [Pseudokineococcus lusitanus]